MSELVSSVLEEQSKSQTENGMPIYTTSLDNLLDFFFKAGASRAVEESSIISLWEKAYTQDKALAYTLLFWARDVRGGAGERRIFRIITKHLAIVHKDELKVFLKLIPEYGRWDDLFELPLKEKYDIIKNGLLVERNGLLAKWLPRKGPFVKPLMKHLGLTSHKAYRQLVVSLSKTVEQKMCSNRWGEIEYKAVPSKAMKNYREAFSSHDNERFKEFLQKVLSGEEKINASAIFPNDIIAKALGGGVKDSTVKDAIVAQWQALPDYVKGNKENILCVCDTSGSMSGTPMEVSVALGLYFSERNEGLFKDAFMTFSTNPKLQYLKGDIISRIQQLEKAEWAMSTDLEAVFYLLLTTAKDNNIDKNQMPTKIIIISDMQFNQAINAGDTALEMIKKRYEDFGYKLPQLIFWNVRDTATNVPVKYNTKGVALISGYSPSIISSVLEGQDLNPVKVMLKTLYKDRYKPILDLAKTL